MSTVSNLARLAGKRLNRTLQAAGVQLVRIGPRPFEEFSDYIPFEETLAAAKAAGVSVGDYVDGRHNVGGTTQATIDRLVDAGVLGPAVRRVCEIGPGSGRYLERTLRACNPAHYEIYETAWQWRDHLVRVHPVVARETDGSTLGSTPDASVDLVQAHKVFLGIPLLAALQYMREMERVVAPGGHVVFDIPTESCMSDSIVDRWIKTGAGYSSYPSMLPRQYVVDLFASRGFTLVTSFIVPNEPGTTEVFAFRR
jgi:hypothetical protein